MWNKKSRIACIGAILLSLTLLSGCAGNSDRTPSGTTDGDYGENVAGSEAMTETESETESETSSDAENGTGSESGSATEIGNESETGTESEVGNGSEPEDILLVVSDMAEIKAELRSAIESLRQPREIDISAIKLSDDPELDVKNLYYSITGEAPELKYAHDITIEINDSILTCHLSYMPYKTGDFPEDFAGVSVDSLQELIAVAEQNKGKDPTDIRVTNTDLEPDEMQRALQQAGGGFVVCSLSGDATQIVYNSAQGMTMEEALDAIAETENLADQVIEDVLEEGMTQREQAEALYSYVTETVRYDFRYYNDRANMPYESQTALGAFRDGEAICGGYSHALKLLFEKVGIKCYNVSGIASNENHMWNVALLDGQWLWFDATADRGNTADRGFRYFAMSELSPNRYRWDADIINPLLEEN